MAEHHTDPSSATLAVPATEPAGRRVLWPRRIGWRLALGFGVLVALMLVAHRGHARPLWTGGAALLGLTVAKLFLVDLSNRGGSERIVAFIAVGVLMLVVGYFAPIPPTAKNGDGDDDVEETA